MFRHLVLCIACAIALTGCSLSKVSPAAATVGSSARQIRLQSSPIPPTSTREVAVTGAMESEPTAQAVLNKPALCDDDESDRPARRARADVRIDYEAKAAEVVQVIRFHNREAAPLAEIVLDVQTNQWEGSFALLDLTVNDLSADYELLLNRLRVELAEPLAPDCWLEIGLRFDLHPTEIRDGLRSYRGFFGYSPRQLNLGHFLPAVAARLDDDWRIHEPVGVGEQIVYDVADWQVSVTVEGAAEPLTLAAPGAVEPLGPGKWEIQLKSSRDFAISLSEEMSLATIQIADDLVAEVYSFADAQINANGIRLDGAEHVLGESEKALDLFGTLFGGYKRERFVIVQGDFPDGMEFTGLVFVGGAWFTNFKGGPRNYLTLISVHEIAHQWWYATVGSDSALNPWLDEALATYSEYLFIEKFYPASRNWWWSFRVANFFPQGKVDSNVYEFATAREYINAVYLRGVQMLHNLRVDIGDDSFFNLLRAYLAAGEGRIADPILFWRQLQPEERALTQATRSEYLRVYDDHSLFVEPEDAEAAPELAAPEESP
ncbi:MAG: M1 family aminopeptidase [Chloroflexi bacterium]|nr:M1 family aminopeptidase [Chloroflexota bacterium]